MEPTPGKIDHDLIDPDPRCLTILGARPKPCFRPPKYSSNAGSAFWSSQFCVMPRPAKRTVLTQGAFARSSRRGFAGAPPRASTASKKEAITCSSRISLLSARYLPLFLSMRTRVVPQVPNALPRMVRITIRSGRDFWQPDASKKKMQSSHAGALAATSRIVHRRTGISLSWREVNRVLSTPEKPDHR
jgi:hypothetical protein